jgi:hypothetical protein
MMRFPLSPLLISIAVALSLVQGCTTDPKGAAVDLRVLGGGRCQALGKTFPCDDVVAALKEAGVEKSAKIHVQVVTGFTVREVVMLLNTLTGTLAAAGYTGVSKTAVAVSPSDP